MTHVDYTSRIECHHEVSRVIVNMSCAWDLDVSSQRDDWVFWKARSRQNVLETSCCQNVLDDTGILTTVWWSEEKKRHNNN